MGSSRDTYSTFCAVAGAGFLAGGLAFLLGADVALAAEALRLGMERVFMFMVGAGEGERGGAVREKVTKEAMGCLTRSLRWARRVGNRWDASGERRAWAWAVAGCELGARGPERRRGVEGDGWRGGVVEVGVWVSVRWNQFSAGRVEGLTNGTGYPVALYPVVCYSCSG